MITIIDSGGANIASIQFALERLGVSAQLSKDADVIRKSSHVILPGVGCANMAMKCLRDNALLEIVRTLVQPVLGICVGMQILFDYSEEGDTQCLGIMSGKVTKIGMDNTQLIIPHMGWNRLDVNSNQGIIKNIPDHSSVYFIHSYAASVAKYTLATASYGETFSAVVQHNNFYGTQFHPERSGVLGSLLLKNFLEL